METPTPPLPSKDQLFPPLIQLVRALLWVLVITIGGAIVQRLFFHPLRKIPGPLTAAISGWDEFYHNIWRDGEWCKTYPKLHKEYNSPVIRIGPNHVHLNDIDAYETVFRVGTNFYKDKTFYTCADNDGSIFSLCDRDEHSERRKVLSSLFSKQAAEMTAPKVMSKLNELLDFMITQSKEGKACNITDLFRALAINWVADTLLGDCGDVVTYAETKPDLLEDIDGLSKLIPTLRFFPYLIPTLNSLAPSTSPAGVAKFKKICENYTRPRINDPIKNISQRSRASVVELLIAHRHEVYHKPPTVDYLAEEAFTFIDAGVDTTGGTLVAAIYHILRDPGILRRLREELDESQLFLSKGTPIDFKKLGNLPYLNAVINESHRIWPALPGPLPRVVPPEGLQVGSFFVPSGTILSSTHHCLHYNETVFPEPKKFKPERWLRTDKWEGDRYLNPYSRGSRACIGINLAQMELRLTLGHLFSHYDLQLCEPTLSSLEWKDHFVAHPKAPVMIHIGFRKA
ncbi:hypothetical protein BBP40_009483 [Aspergillus hancockii]|uniref:Cytochrome P450 monooxygenase hkm5 n=1 Tax=Aspergillus hancockii TaxID=1873369 RepID=HKM5_ASPHA|nr:RecName: Full=Cytochrome P450 monooxygenase hkm5; AltName: Full=Hancockiamides biosynthesis cluster protein 5 [Aspergillus hancockii]KAF7597145.1 hypothetical protein BBP40_009483 [Aspergillus hancockii]